MDTTIILLLGFSLGTFVFMTIGALWFANRRIQSQQAQTMQDPDGLLQYLQDGPPPQPQVAQKKPPILLVILGLVLLFGGGAALAGYGFYVTNQAESAKDWPTVDGAITSSSYEYTTTDDGTTTYKPILEYSYQVDGVTYENDRMDFRVDPRKFDTLNELQAWVRQEISRGAKLTVYYNPDDPADSVLIPETDQFPTIFIFAGIGLLALGTISLIFRLVRGLRGSTHV